MTADIVRNAIATAFPDGLPLTPKEIEAVARNFDAAMVDKLEPFDWQFLAQPERLTDLLFEFIQRHPGTLELSPPLVHGHEVSNDCRNHQLVPVHRLPK